MRKAFFLLIGVCFSFFAHAQLPANSIGINPPGLKWRQIQTDRVQVIFPQGLDSAGQRVANMVHYLWDRDHLSIGEKRIPVTILLQNQTVISNGFVTPGPFRSEFFTTSPQFNEPTDWLDLLAIHEYRHVQQFSNTRRGITEAVRTVLGSWPWGGLFGLALPRWYFEGDATGMETALTRSGRGRQPAFNMEYRSLVLNDVKYGYEKAAAGSLRDFVPNWYHLGYFMTTHARRHHGPDIWAGVLDDAVRFRGLFFPFSHALKRRTGLSTKGLYEATYRELDSLWSADKKQAGQNSEARLVNTAEKPTVINYVNPHYLPDGRILAERSGFDRIPAYMAIDRAGREEKLTAPGFLFSPEENTLSVQKDRIVWAELGFDPRWSNRTYSIIKTYDLKTAQKKKLSTRSRLFSPTLSHGGDRIVAVEATEDMRYHLVLINAESGAVLRRLPNPEGYFLAYPRWMPNDESLVVVANKNETARLIEVNPEEQTVRELTAPTQHQLSHPFPQGDYVFFSAAYTGVNNIFALRQATGEVFQLTDAASGAFQPSVSDDGRRLLYSEFTLKGFDLRELELETATWKPTPDVRAIPFGLNYFQPLVEQEGGGSIVPKVPNQTFEVRKFNKWSGIINPHSLLPYVEHPVYGLQLLSDNKFSTLSTSAGAFFNVNEQTFTYLGDLNYAEFFPVVNGLVQRSNRAGTFFNFAPATDTSVTQTNYREEWRENIAGGGLSLPLNLTSGNAITRLNLRADYQYRTLNVENRFDRPDNNRRTFRVANARQFEDFYRQPLRDGHLNVLDLGMTFFSFRRTAIQNLNPRLGLILGLRYRTTFSSSELQADNFLGRADAFLPGLSRNHNIFLNFMFQQQDMIANYRFSDLFFYSRGYGSQAGSQFYKLGFNYSLPLAYPDMALGPVAFLKRIKLNGFFDYGRINYSSPFIGGTDLHSAGLELGFDFRLFRLVEVDAGIRYSYLFSPANSPNGRAHQFDFLLISISQ